MAKVKMKTHSGAKKRFSVSGSGKVTFQKGVLSPAFEARLKAIMPYA